MGRRAFINGHIWQWVAPFEGRFEKYGIIVEANGVIERIVPEDHRSIMESLSENDPRELTYGIDTNMSI